MSPMFVLQSFHTMGWKGSQYMQVLQDLEAQVPVLAKKSLYD